MFQVPKLAALALAASFVSALVFPRATPPASWDTNKLEPYDDYHNRYLNLTCKSQHNTTFFDQCCHPLTATQQPSALPALCSTSTPTANSTSDSNDGEEPEDVKGTPVPDVPSAAGSSEVATGTAEPQPTSSSHKTIVALDTGPAPDASTEQAVNTGGFATFFYQKGVAGACGKVHGDYDLIAAIDSRRYGDTGRVSTLCGRKVSITNNNNRLMNVTVTIADACPTCENSNSIDLSEGAFLKLATLAEGMVPISWVFVSTGNPGQDT